MINKVDSTSFSGIYRNPYIKFSNTQLETVGNIVDNYIGHYVYMSQELYKTLYGEETIETPSLPDDNVGGLGDTNQNIGDTNTSDGVQQGGDNTGSGTTNDVSEDNDNSVNDNNIGNNTTNDNSEDSTSDSENVQDEAKKDDNQNDGLNVIIVISVIGVLAIVAYFILRANKISENIK